ncbi:MAG: hypothetical protein KDB23_26220 [Planctomycetales bacterium]|nr:hypothetical protein [Planctomycetales bacterium]
MISSTTEMNRTYQWQPQPAAWAWVMRMVERACRVNGFLDELSQRMQEQTGTRLVDWLDHIAVDRTDTDDATLRQLGFVFNTGVNAWVHPGGLFPLVPRVTGRDTFPLRGLAIKVESVEDFAAAHGLAQQVEIVGEPGAALRYAVVTPQAALSCVVVERHGHSGWTIEAPTAAQLEMLGTVARRFDDRTRPVRGCADAYADAVARFDEVAAVVGRDRACDLFFAAERRYWESRNHAARVQHDRQRQLGLGWANHDHHTYRSSREHFAALVGTLEHMGFVCRERFYAGAQAGWGAQVLEQKHCGLTVFADVDLSPDEVAGDFAHDGLAPRAELGTVGVWCKLHGEAFLSAGLHHLECQFDFDLVQEQLQAAGVDTMAPFTDFSFLRQAFTAGEVWSIDAEHLAQLVREGALDAAQADEFARQGARGSHLEILERNDGYKGFNQTGISEIIARTDPRRG